MTPQPTTQRCFRAWQFLVAACWTATAVAAQAVDALQSYAGACDASAAVALDHAHFAVANDENNLIALFRHGQPGAVASIDFGRFLGLGPGEEADIEGAAAIGARIYWLTSHARDSKGRAQPGRQRLFATEIVPGSPPTLASVGVAYTGLLRDILAAPALAPYGLAAAAERAAEAEGGFNIEGLAATPDGRLLIGLRNPLVRRRALVIPLANPDAVVMQGRPAQLGPPIELELGGRGVRSIEFVGGSYLIAAGPSGDEGSFAIYRWSGRALDAPEALSGVALGDLRPEALFMRPGGAQFVLLSDDGGVKDRRGGRACKELPASRQSFRALAVAP